MRLFLSFICLLSATFGFAQKNQIELSLQTGHTGDITEVRLSHDNHLIASAASDHKIIVWDIKSGKQLAALYGHTDVINDIDFFPGDSTLISCSDDGSVRIWDLNHKKEINKLQDFNEAVKCVRAGNDGLTFATASSFIRVYNRTSLNFKRLDLVAKERFDCLSYSSDGSRILFGGEEENWVYAYNLHTNAVDVKFFSQAIDLDFSPDGEEIYVCTPYGKLYVWNDSTRLKNGVASNKILNKFNAVAVTNSEFFLGNEEGNIYSYKHSNFKKRGVYQAHLSSITALDVSNDDRLLVSAGSDQFIVVWDIATGRMLQTLRGSVDKLNCVGFSTDGKAMALGYNNGIIRHWNTLSNKIVTTVFQPNIVDEILGWDYTITNTNIDNDSIVTVQAYKRKRSFENKDIYSDIMPVQLTWNINENRYEILPGSKKQETLKNQYFKDIRKGHVRDLQAYFLDTANFYDENALVSCRIQSDRSLMIKSLEDGTDKKIITEHTDLISAVAINPVYSMILTTSWDGTMRYWDIETGGLIAKMGSFGVDDYIYIDKDNYYYSSKGALKNVAFRMGNKAFDFDQFDIIYNRPDIVFSHFPYSEPELLADYKRAYEKRMSKLGLTTEDLKVSEDVPTINVELPSELSTSDGLFTFRISAESNQENLERLYVYVNGVPEFGIGGKHIDGKKYESEIKLDLCYGINKVQVFVSNESGQASYKEYFELTNKEKRSKPDVYLVTLGASKFKQEDFNLTYAAKDADDIQSQFQRSRLYKNVHSLNIKNDGIVKSKIDTINTFLAAANPDDVVILFAAGHGVLDANLDYYYASYDMDFDSPEGKGIPYSYFEDVLDNTKSRNKVMFLDACHSGEVDKEEVIKTDAADTEIEGITFRHVGVDISNKNMDNINSFELSKRLFADTRASNGSTVMSSAGAGEYAIEGDQWSNGVFTYCLLDGLNSKEADLNHDKRIMLSELQRYLKTKVSRMTAGQQQPNERSENLQNDFRIW